MCFILKFNVKISSALCQFIYRTWAAGYSGYFERLQIKYPYFNNNLVDCQHLDDIQNETEAGPSESVNSNGSLKQLYVKNEVSVCPYDGAEITLICQLKDVTVTDTQFECIKISIICR